MTTPQSDPIQTLRDKKLAILTKFYGGERKPHYHDFSIDNGVCNNCSIFIGDAETRICLVITPDEVKLFRSYDER